MSATILKSPRHKIELRVHNLARLFESLDPSPFNERALDPAAHRYILSCAQEAAPSVPVQLVIFLARSLGAQTGAIVEGIHNHFRFEAEIARRDLHHQLRIGRRWLLWGLLILAACSTLGGTLSAHVQPVAQFFSDGLLVVGWVVLWRSVDTLLFERWRIRDDCRWLERLAQIDVEFRLIPD